MASTAPDEQDQAFLSESDWDQDEIVADILSEMAPSAGPPPTLPPSVEEAYRRKCIQLKQRLNDVEASNDAARLRLARMNRGIEKMRLERAFLLEQLAKRTSTNVEDSEGSPSPPPTPKEKPLRTKRGHRKPSFLTNLGDGRPGSSFIQQNPSTISPSSDAFSHSHPERDQSMGMNVIRRVDSPKNNGSYKSRQARPSTPFEMFANEMRSVLTVQKRKEIAEGTYDVNEALAWKWRDLGTTGQKRYVDEFQSANDQALKDDAMSGGRVMTDGAADTPDEAEAEDIEMPDEAADAGEDAEAGFTAVNRG